MPEISKIQLMRYESLGIKISDKKLQMNVWSTNQFENYEIYTIELLLYASSKFEIAKWLQQIKKRNNSVGYKSYIKKLWVFL